MKTTLSSIFSLSAKSHGGNASVNTALSAFAAFAILAILLFARPAAIMAADASEPLYKNPAAPIEDRINDIIPRLTLEEKIGMIHGDQSAGTSMDTKAVPRLGIPRMSMTDGPHGVRWDQSTALPTGVTIASTWNEDLIRRAGVVLGHEALAKGRNMLLGPCVNIHRVPQGGRNFESYSEDPYLAGRIAVGYIQGVQSTGVTATVKHFAMNNQEIERGTISVETDERTMQEIYLPQFKAAIQEGGSWSVMCSYNRINTIYACENKHLLTDILKNDWGFKGFVVSDWGAVHSTIPTAMSGMDVEMPDGTFTGDYLIKAVNDGKVPMPVIDDKVRRVLRVMMLSGLFDHKIESSGAWFDAPESRAVALDVAREGIVLLKNNGNILPIDRNKIKKIAVIGPNAAVAQVGGGGSSTITPTYKVSPLEGILKQAGGNVEVKYAQGCDLQSTIDYEAVPASVLAPTDENSGDAGLKAEYFDAIGLKGDPKVTRIERQVDAMWNDNDPMGGFSRSNFSVRWSGRLVPPVPGKYKLVLVSDGVSRLFINGKVRATIFGYDAAKSKIVELDLKPGETATLRVEYESIGGGGGRMVRLGWLMPGRSPMADAVKLASESDMAIVVVGLDRRFEGEGRDRDNIELPGLQTKLIEEVLKVNKNTVVVMVNGTPMVINSWVDKVPGIVEAWYAGEEGGRAIGEVLFGDVNPSGKLTITWPHDWKESPAYGNYPGKDGKVFYKEGIFLGYRYYDTKDIAPVFPFGHGLSYTTFEYSDLAISPEKMAENNKTVEVSLTVRNTGKFEGREAVQLYVHDYESSAPRPLRELKGIKKISLKPGESKKVVFTIDRSALSFFSPDKNKWIAEPGKFQIQIGSSSRDIRLKGDLTLEK